MVSVSVSALGRTDLHFIDQKSMVNTTVKSSWCKNFCQTSNDSQITSPSSKMGHLLIVRTRRSICYRVRRSTLSLRRCGLQIVQTSTPSTTRYGVFFGSGSTPGKSKMWRNCNSVSLRNGNAWTSAWLTMQSNSGVNIFALVWLQQAAILSNHCRNSNRIC